MVTTIIALLVAFAIPCLYLYFGIYQRDFFQTGNVTLIIYCFLWGAFAYVLAYWTNSTALKLNLISRDNLVMYSAPIVEEIFKGAILVYLIRRSDFTYFVDGAIYGFTAGIGFAVFENMEYVFGHPGTALALAIARVFSTNLIHATASGSIGIALGLSRFERSNSIKRLLTVLGSILIAMSLHMAFNNLVNRNAPILLAILVGLAGAGVIVIIMLQGMKDLKSWVNEKIKEERTVTNNEASIVNQFEKVDDILEPFASRFGLDKASIAREMLLMQAQMSIHKKTAEKHQDEKMRQASETQVNELRRKMDENRKKLGWYCMLQLRGIFPEEGNPWWGTMQMSVQVPKEQAGTGLWTALNKKVKDVDASAGAEGE
jgi:RsiW-degrading membrane proteinase PrsW (M82 family)